MNWKRAYQIIKDPFGLQPRVRSALKGRGFDTKTYRKGHDSGLVFRRTFGIKSAKAAEPSQAPPSVGGGASTSNTPNTQKVRTGGVVASKQTFSAPKKRKKSKKRKNFGINIKKQRKAQEKALMKALAAQREQAQRVYQGGKSRIDQLLDVLAQGFSQAQQTGGSIYDTARQALEQSKQRGLEEFGDEKAKDLARLKSFYARIGTGDSEQQAQALERMQGQYAKRFGQLEETAQQKLADLEARKRAYLQGLQSDYERQRQGYLGKESELGDIYQNTLSRIKAGEYSGRADIEAKINNLMKDIQDYQFRQAQLDQGQQRIDLDRLRTQYQISRPHLGKAGAEGGFTPLQRQKIMSDYSKDLQNLLDRYAYAPEGGREQVYNALVGEYGSVLDPNSIKQDIFGTYATPGWEGRRKALLEQSRENLSPIERALLGQ